MTISNDHPIIVWVGRLYGHDGYGTAAQLHVGALRDAGAPVVAVDIASQSLVGSVPDGLIRTDRFGNDLVIHAADPHRPITVIVHDRPDRYPHVATTGRARLIGYSYWETTSLPPSWAGWMVSMDGVWTSSSFNADAFARAGVPSWMIDIVEHPVDSLSGEVASSRQNLRSRWPESTVFLSMVSGGASRRDLSLLLEALAMAFDQSDDVALVLKAAESGADAVSATLERVMQSMPARSSDQWPKVYVLPATLTREQMLRLHGSVDCYVSCERGNGWDLPAFDSLSMGVPVVATDFGASTTYVDPADSYVVEASTALVACDAGFNVRHSLYSGHYWPYVDPAALAIELRRAHDDPEDRLKRGSAAAQRINHDFDRTAVASHVADLTATSGEVGWRSSEPAEVRVSNGDVWPKFGGTPTLADDPRLHEAVLAGLLLDPAIMRPRSPRDFQRAYKRATAFARANDSALAGTPVRSALADAMKTTARNPVGKVSAILRLRRLIERESARLGDPDDLRALPSALEDHRAAVGGEASTVTPERREQARRVINTTYGPFRSPDAEAARLAELHNRYHGRVFILGGSRGLPDDEVSKLAGASTFAVDTIPHFASQLDWSPTFFTLLHRVPDATLLDEISQLKGTIKFVSERLRGAIPREPDTYWYWTRRFGVHIDDQFEEDITRGIPTEVTALVTAIQQAFFVGFKEIVLLDVDGGGPMRAPIEQPAPARRGTGPLRKRDGLVANSQRGIDNGPDRHDAPAVDIQRMLLTMRKAVDCHGGRLMGLPAI